MRLLTSLNILIASMLLLNVLIFPSCMEEGGLKKGRPSIEDYSAKGSADATATATPSPTPTPPQRPTDDIAINSDFCVCAGGKNLLNNDCNAYCSNTTETKSTLYANVTIGSEVEMFDGLGNLKNWCNIPIEGGKNQVECRLLVESESSSLTPMNINFTGDNSFYVSVDQLMKKIRYRAKVVVYENGYTAQTSSIQLYMPATATEANTQGPLRISSMARYTCISRAGGTKSDDGSLVFTDMIRQHYFVGENVTAPTLPPCDSFLICHDPSKGEYDSPLLTRFEWTPIAFRVWDPRDLRTYSTKGDKSNLDINLTIQERLQNEYNITSESGINLFRTISPSTGPVIDSSTCISATTSSTNSSTNGTSSTTGTSGTTTTTTPNTTSGTAATTNQISGIILQPWVRDYDKSISYCPTQDDYNNGEPIMQILKEIIGVDTEALYLADREPTTYKMPNNITIYADNHDPLLIPASTLQKIWFHYESGKYYTPTSVTAGQKAVRFYWPITNESIKTPFQQKSFQKIYTVKTQAEIEGSLNDRTTIQAKDKRIGCIPVSAD